MSAASKVRFTPSAISTRRLVTTVLPLALMIIGAILVKPSDVGWWLLGAGLALSLSGLGAWVWMAGLRGTAIETGEWTYSMQHRAVVVSASLARSVGPLLMLIGVFV